MKNLAIIAGLVGSLLIASATFSQDYSLKRGDKMPKRPDPSLINPLRIDGAGNGYAVSYEFHDGDAFLYGIHLVCEGSVSRKPFAELFNGAWYMDNNPTDEIIDDVIYSSVSIHELAEKRPPCGKVI